ncbi:MAG: efflux RND transporter periplasmic adaptor subunit [Dysgonamonadaceae bacterium]|jgi:RND family efflux transporter MFP subunit|nr:efflux RND transporter periplasmic adaptor subunit [Dysgonamonadaceae bacterium]
MNRFLLFGLSVTTLLTACSKKKEGEMQERAVPVKVIRIAETAPKVEKAYVGTVEESVAVALSFSEMGTVQQVLASEGQLVRKGQLLAALNPATAQNAYEASKAKLVQAQDAYDRLTKVHENGSLPDIKYAEVEAGLQQAKSMAAITKKSLDDCRLYAPLDGVIADRSIEAGVNVMPGVPVFKLVSVNKVDVKISVPENEISSIAEGQAATIVVPALDHAAFSGKIEMKGVAANALSHTYDVKIRIDKQQNLTGFKGQTGLLLPGMVCKVGVENFRPLPSEIVVPNRAIRISPNGRRYVWLSDENVARRQFVRVGDLTGNGIIVSEGLSAGDNIIVEGFQKISEGARLNCDYIND